MCKGKYHSSGQLRDHWHVDGYIAASLYANALQVVGQLAHLQGSPQASHALVRIAIDVAVLRHSRGIKYDVIFTHYTGIDEGCPHRLHAAKHCCNKPQTCVRGTQGTEGRWQPHACSRSWK